MIHNKIFSPLKHVPLHLKNRRHFLYTAAVCLGLTVPLIFTGCSASLSSEERAAAADQTIEWLIGRYGEAKDAQLKPMLHRIVARLSEAVYRSALESQLSRSIAEDFTNYPWRVVVLDSTAPNAFSAGAGRIVMTRGMISRLRSEAEFAAIISHEMSHEILGHTAEALSKDQSSSNEGRPAPVFSSNPNYEIDADTLGVKILSVARYDTTAALYALTLGYRTNAENVSDEQAKWFELRAARLKQSVDEIGSREPATVSTREFNKVRWDLGGS
jgi:predicted Zn-dependent protease